MCVHRGIPASLLISSPTPPTTPPSFLGVFQHPPPLPTPHSCIIAGTGILQLPYALRLSGWVGIAVILFSAFVNEYTGKLLIECLYVDE